MWLLQEEMLREIQRFEALEISPTAEQVQRFAALEAESPKEAAARITKRTGSATAEIQVDGLLTERPSLIALLLGTGGTTYRSIRQALAEADADAGVSDALFSVASPGGHVDGLFETLAAIQAFSKPIRVRAKQAQSAAYAIAAVAGPIEAESRASMFGSIGVVGSIPIDDKSIDIANTESPKKRPDVNTPEGKQVYREQLDALFELFVEAIADGRAASTQKTSFTKKMVTENFGRGATLLADQAKEAGMIDIVPRPTRKARVAAESPETSVQTAVHGGPKERRNAMTKEELKAQQPELYASIIAEGKEAGRKEGEAAERDRVEAHLTMGESSGDMKTATESIRNGASMTAKLQAQYFAAAMNRRDAAACQTDSNTAGAAVDGDPPAPAAPAAAKSLLDVFAADLPAKPKTAAA